MSYDRILILTDGSKQAMNAIEEGIRLASKLDVTIDVLYVAEIEEDKEYGEKLITEVQEIAKDAGIDCSSFVKHGDSFAVIAEYASRNSYDLIVMGSDGRSNLGDILIGSTAERVITETDVPVTVVNKPPADRLERVEEKLQNDDIIHGTSGE